MIKVLVLCFIAALWLELPSGGDAECCHVHAYNKFRGRGKRCDDCSTPWKFCGVGDCNVLGCNCDGGCRTGRCKGEQYGLYFGKRDLATPQDARDVIRAADTDGDGRMSLKEAHGHLGSRDLDVVRAVAALDLDKDHFLDATEIDGNTGEM